MGLTLLTLTLLSPVLIWQDYLSLRRERREMATLQSRAGEHDQLLGSVSQRLVEIQAEMAGWRALHARIWEPLGPEASGAGERGGVGGVGQPVPEPGDGPPSLLLQVERLSASVMDEGQKLRALDRLMARAGRFLGALPTRWPVRGMVNSEFGRRISPWTGVPEMHSGIDIAAEMGTPVKAPAPGIVAFAGSAPDYGNTVVIDHGHEIRTLFGHLKKIEVVQGQKVERGQQVALTGNTGKTSGPHLHYEIQVRGQAVNPRGYLWE